MIGKSPNQVEKMLVSDPGKKQNPPRTKKEDLFYEGAHRVKERIWNKKDDNDNGSDDFGGFDGAGDDEGDYDDDKQ